MLKPHSIKTAVSFGEALRIHANAQAQVANFGVAHNTGSGGKSGGKHKKIGSVVATRQHDSSTPGQLLLDGRCRGRRAVS